ncbi:DUF4242 domain-containing protein [Actinomyces capricornis]|uniref:DUF4242 domain-containing protein n=1 Tax=Actinomyces capricornis TaxID=2755559 RepID=A0ABM7U9M6_9ACTO|nr:DUF4242 domain-containing protein [Actinomyces capricornis]BDA64113.1 hypothetical protein MANAM107_09470 [Actinomyces capricornis]
MSLYLFEIVPATEQREAAQSVISAIAEAASSVSASVLESQVTSGHGRVFSVVEFDGDPAALGSAVSQGLEATEITGPDEVRLVGAQIEDIRGARGSADYLVEWDIPAEIDMETYLTRKKANSPKYAQVPEVSFLRTYVREDTVKCLCFYDAPDEETVVRAREVVSTPIDRLHALEG